MLSLQVLSLHAFIRALHSQNHKACASAHTTSSLELAMDSVNPIAKGLNDHLNAMAKGTH